MTRRAKIRITSEVPRAGVGRQAPGPGPAGDAALVRSFLVTPALGIQGPSWESAARQFWLAGNRQIAGRLPTQNLLGGSGSHQTGGSGLQPAGRFWQAAGIVGQLPGTLPGIFFDMLPGMLEPAALEKLGPRRGAPMAFRRFW